MDLRQNNGNLFDYKDQYSALIMLGTNDNEECKAEIQEQANTYKSMNDLYSKFEDNVPFADNIGNGYFFFVPFSSSLAESAFVTLKEAFVIMRECGAENMCIKVCGSDTDLENVKNFLNEYDKNSPLGDVLLLS
ncbi:MAG: hypothetical protein MJZ19_04655 [Paludibacteraceae bacterium]|nr:hypothetical protein [Paludibacteraceae bacterium]